MTYHARMSDIEPIRWQDDHLLLLDQTRLPQVEEWITVRHCRDAVSAIREMRVRGAPAIGVTGAFAVALAAQDNPSKTMPTFLRTLEAAAEAVAAARPTAVNLGRAVARCLEVARQCSSPAEARARLLEEACLLQAEDVRANKALGAHGAALIPDGGTVLTHCNAGALATAGYGTALGVIRAAWDEGTRFSMLCTETRPWLQGARLTMWELQQLGIPASLIVDSAAASLMSRGEVQVVLVGADRIAANGDVANKIGTYSLAVLAKSHDIPFYVAATLSTVDMDTQSGEAIPIEERGASEVTNVADHAVAPEGISVRNPVFDVTPFSYVTAIVTEQGVARAPYESALRRLTRQQQV